MHVLQTLLLVLAAKAETELQQLASCSISFILSAASFSCLLASLASHSLTSSQLWPKSIPPPLISWASLAAISIAGNIYSDNFHWRFFGVILQMGLVDLMNRRTKRIKVFLNNTWLFNSFASNSGMGPESTSLFNLKLVSFKFPWKCWDQGKSIDNYLFHFIKC